MRHRYRYDPDLDCLVEIGGNYFEEKPPQTPNVISDDVGAGVNGLRHMPSGRMIDSKSEHRKENRARGLEEVGNQTDFASIKHNDAPRVYENEVKAAREQIEGNYNGTRDWLRHRERQ